MVFPDAYYKVRIGWNKDSALYKLQTLEAETGTDIIAGLINKTNCIRAFNKVNIYGTYREKEYSLVYKTADGKLAVIMFKLWPVMHPRMGVIETSIVSEDCILFKKYQKRLFEIYVFKNMKHKQHELFQMMCCGDLKNQFTIMAEQRPF